MTPKTCGMSCASWRDNPVADTQLSAIALAQHLPEQIHRIEPKRFCDSNELRDVHLTLVASDHSYNGMRSLQERRQFALGKILVLPRAYPEPDRLKSTGYRERRTLEWLAT